MCWHDQSVMRSIQNTKTAGGKPAEMIVALHQEDFGAKPGRSNRGGGTGGATADHQNIGFGEYRNLSRKLRDRFVRASATHLASTAEQLDTLSSSDTAAVIAEVVDEAVRRVEVAVLRDPAEPAGKPDHRTTVRE